MKAWPVSVCATVCKPFTVDAVKLNVNLLPRRGMSIENEALFVRTRF